MRVLQVVTDNARRGAPVFGVVLGAQLAAMGYDVRTVALFSTQLDGERLDIQTLGARALGARTLWRLSVQMSTADVVIAHGSRTLPACAIAGSAPTSAPFVYRNIGDPDYWAPTVLRRARVRLFYRRAAFVAALWPSSRDALEQRFGVPARKLTIIPNGVDTAPLLSPPQDVPEGRRQVGLHPERPTVGYVGALSPEKDVATLLDAIPDGWQAVIAGDGPLRASLEQHGRGREHVEVAFLGMTDSPRAAFDLADVAALTSLSEGLPAVVIEAGALGLPAVATDVGGVGTIVADGVTGRLVEPGDVLGTRQALLEAYDHREAWGAAARQHCISEFSIEAVARRWADVIEQVARG